MIQAITYLYAAFYLAIPGFIAYMVIKALIGDMMRSKDDYK